MTVVSEIPRFSSTNHAVNSDGESNIYNQRLGVEKKEAGLKALVKNGHVLSIAIFASLGGLIYGFNQGMFGQILNMASFRRTINADSIDNPTTRGLLTSILELGAWVGALSNGYLADKLGRKLSVVLASCIFIVGAVIQATSQSANQILAGRFVTGIGVGSLSMIVPLYNAELAPAEVRGGLVALQQLAITFGIVVSYFVGYGTNFISGAGNPNQSNAAWLIPVTIQILPALVLAAGFLFFMPQSPRWLIDKNRDDEAIEVIAKLRRLPKNSEAVTLEFLEIKAQHLFEVETDKENFPQYQDGSAKSNFLLGVKRYQSLFVNKSIRKRTWIGIFIMLLQQWTGINGILYFAPFLFQGVGLVGGTLSLLASGVGGILMFLATIPAVLWIDKLGRRPVLIVGALGMAVSHFVVAGICGGYHMNFTDHSGVGWVAAVFIWLFVIHFGYSWGPCGWIVVSEIFPLGVRAIGVSVATSSNWLNNFAVGMATSDMLDTMKYGMYIFYGVFCLIGAAYVYFMVPETKGRTLEEIDELFDEAGTISHADKVRMERIWRQLGLLDDKVPILDEKLVVEHSEVA